MIEQGPRKHLLTLVADIRCGDVPLGHSMRRVRVDCPIQDRDTRIRTEKDVYAKTVEQERSRFLCFRVKGRISISISVREFRPVTV